MAPHVQELSLGRSNHRIRILSGAPPAALLVLLVDRALAGVEHLLRPRGMD